MTDRIREALPKLPQPDCHPQYSPAAMIAYGEACVEAALAAAPQAAEPVAWINVEDRLPEKNVEVLVAFAEMSIPSTGQYTGKEIDHDGWCYPAENKDWFSNTWPTVTHWMPLPDHPNEADFKAAPQLTQQPTEQHETPLSMSQFASKEDYERALADYTSLRGGK